MELGVPKGSVLGLLLFNIFITDTFFLLNEIAVCSYADDTTIYCSHQELKDVTIRLENNMAKLNNWLAGKL